MILKGMDPKSKVALFILIYLLAFFLMGWVFPKIFAMLIAALAIIFLVEPIANIIRKYLKKKALSSGLALVVFYVFVVWIVVALIPPMLKETNTLINFINTFFEKEMWKSAKIFKDYPQVEELIGRIGKLVEPKLSEFLSGLITTITTGVPSGIGFIFFVVLLSVYGVVYFDGLRRNIDYFFPASTRSIAHEFMRRMYGHLQRYVVAVTLTAALTGLSMGTFLKLIGVKYYLTLGAWAFLTNYIPIVGVFLELIPMIIVILPMGVKILIWFVVVTTVVHATAFIVFLRLMQGYSQLGPIAMIIAIIIVTELFGIPGAFIAVPMAIVVRDYWMEFVNPRFEKM